MLDVQVVKFLVIVGLFVLTLGLGLLPLLILRCMQTQTARGISFHKQARYRRTLSILSCFAAGVFLATCLLGLLPDVRRDLAMALDALQLKTEFPVSEFAMVIGLFAVLTIEQVICFVKERKSKQTFIGHISGSKTSLVENDHGTMDDHVDNCDRAVTNEHSSSGINDRPCYSPSYSLDKESSHDSHIHFVHQYFTLRVLCLLLAVSLHSLLEGLAVGLQRSTMSVLGVSTALLLHKGILSFSLGMNLVQSKLSRPAIIVSVVIFGLSSPVGIGIGIGIIDLWISEVSILVQGILQGIACGTFLYVTFFEVLPREFNSSEIRLVKVTFLIIGFTVVSGTVFLEQEYN
ncbi:zinc transporter ZIP1-like [Pecten maximus]|uniref:zinc transporter ZIP1-like n=1 Tax=Pecten maximus TaxID=6579 RepID=UPI001458C11D|nr:zinc transporter ZIP1-like [Pecten maximus]